ncbi:MULTISPECIES: hypothetical protein [unclassified Nocardioides]|uniref:hypothetical protein n=1 Tax=unclassified Nocardioides TaxID=2615069 RepID=UPI0007009D10|nr:MULTISPECIES: hypothetical protein [unclassified Nocardioides]KQY61796.1 hypothetical protein ASD30_25445 [Nocardioides sp. Root140]KQZ70799.1 hypothetical protein ASD66_14645 [Nocardioides sp. Root151]KRF10872.1 hypothetical protein ASH02_18670 [Nocardioides sp. Soil796]
MRLFGNALPDEVRAADLPTGEKALAGAVGTDGVVLVGTRDALYVGERRIPWETVEKADWSQDASTLTVTEVGSWGEVRPVHVVPLDEPGRLLELVRERVTASVVLQRHVPIRGRRGVFVIARRAPRGDQPVQWVYEFEEGVDPDDPEVRRRAAAALEVVRGEVGHDL